MADSDVLCILGVISDVQYADVDSTFPKFGNNQRFYRHSLVHLQNAIQEFETTKCSAVLQLGDLIDGKNKQQSLEALEAVLSIVRTTEIPFYHSIGNHELYNFSHVEATTRLLNSLTDRGYYSFSPVDSLRVICLDCYDISLLGRDQASEEYQVGQKFLSINQNDDRNSPTGLEDLDKRFVKFNGAVGERQLQWLADELRSADLNNQKVIVFGHVGLLPEVTFPSTLLWNYSEVAHVLESSKSVILALSGHTHQYLSTRSATGKLYVSLPGVVETPPDGRGWGKVEFFKTRVEMTIYEGETVHQLSSTF